MRAANKPSLQEPVCSSRLSLSAHKNRAGLAEGERRKDRPTPFVHMVPDSRRLVNQEISSGQFSPIAPLHPAGRVPKYRLESALPAASPGQKGARMAFSANKKIGVGLAEGEEMRKRPAPVNLLSCYRPFYNPAVACQPPKKVFFADAEKKIVNHSRFLWTHPTSCSPERQASRPLSCTMVATAPAWALDYPAVRV